MWDEWISYLVTGLTTISAIIGYVVYFMAESKSTKLKRIAGGLMEAQKITEATQRFIIEAESFSGFLSGEQKKMHAMQSILCWAYNNNIKVDEIELSRLIDAICNLTKMVNKRNKDMEVNSEE